MNKEEIFNELHDYMGRINLENGGIYLSQIKIIVEKLMKNYDLSKKTASDIVFQQLESDNINILDNLEDYDSNIDLNNTTGNNNPMIIQYLNDIGKIPLLKESEERDLYIKCTNGDKDARKKLLESNLRYVVVVAKRYVGQGLDLLDLINEGNIGLMIAIDHFDYTKGCKLLSYADSWIKQTIIRAIMEKGKPIRMSVSMTALMNKFTRYQKAYYGINNCFPSDKDIMSELKISLEKLKELKKSNFQIDSLDRTINEEEDSSLADVIPDDNINSIIGVTEQKNLQEAVAQVLSELSDREQDVLKLRFGIDCDRQHSLEEIGKKYHFGRERIRQIEKKSLLRIKYSPSGKKLASFLD